VWIGIPRVASSFDRVGVKTPTYTELLQERDELRRLLDDLSDEPYDGLHDLLNELRYKLQIVLGTNRAADPPHVDDVWTALERLDDAINNGPE
jgi:hypothetical protein